MSEIFDDGDGSPLDEEVYRVFARIQEIGIAAQDSGLDPDDSPVIETLGAAASGGVGVCRIRKGETFGCYPGMTEAACFRIADTINAQAEWDSGGSC